MALECVANKTLQGAVYVTHVLPALSEHLSATHLTNTAAHTLTVKVTDAGDRVAGARVSLAGTTKTTNSHGVATFHLAKHFKPGRYPVVARHAGYLRAHATLKVTS